MAIDKDSYLSWLGFETMWKKITNSFAKKSTTISGYGITDAYTKKEVDDKISSGVSGVEVGGRNLAVGTGSMQIVTGESDNTKGTWRKFGTATLTTATETIYGIPSSVVKIDNTGGSGGICSDKFAKFVPGKSYTVSFWAKSSTGKSTVIFNAGVNGTITTRPFGNDYEYPELIGTSWTRVSHTFTNYIGTAGELVSIIYINNAVRSAGTSILSIAQIKLEEGNVATNWTPAPEDIDIDINKKLDTSGGTMSGQLDMGNYGIENCQSIIMTGNIDMDDNGGINNCTFIEGSGANDTIEFQSSIDATQYGFWNGSRLGKEEDLVLGNGSFKGIRTEIYTGGGIYSYDDKIPTSEAVYNCIENKIDDSSIEHITYSNLKTLRDNSGLLPGKWYRITDYKTTTSITNTQSANHIFDILVMAVSRNALSEIAFATKNAYDTYFSGRKLQAWELRYCLDNDTFRFGWASNTAEGRGVIYYMKDEYNNEAPYDFKNIQFRDHLVNETANTPVNVYKAVGNDGSSENMNLLLSFNSAYRYTFATTSGADSSLTGGARNNRIEPYFSGSMMYLNFITMSSGSIYGMNFGKNCHNITIEASSSLSDNVFNGANNFIYIKCKSFYDNIFDKEASQISICGNYGGSSSNNIWANYFGPQSAYIALVLQSHVRCLNFMSRNRNICLYGTSAQCIQFGEQAMCISWIEQATFAAAKASVSYSDTPSRLNTTGYFLYNRFMAGSEGISIGIPFLFSCDFQSVRYMVLNKQSSATYSFKTPTHWLSVSVGDYGSSSEYKVITPPNNSTSQVFMRKNNYQELKY